CKQALEFPLTF
nr:immunoglobulin light chain junction region [Macaca mulatta]